MNDTKRAPRFALGKCLVLHLGGAPRGTSRRPAVVVCDASITLAEDFVGRLEELGTLESALAEARAERPRVVLVHGPAGIGKSALLRRLLGGRKGVRVLSASEEETETALTYGVINQLLAGLPCTLPDPLTSLDADNGPSADPLTVGAALVELLGLLEDDGPVVVVVDDAHWADMPSLQALVFAFRRLRVDRVLGILAAREEALASLPPSLHRLISTEVGIEVPLAGLPPPDLRRLATSLVAGTLPVAAVERLAQHTGGNPLHVRALLAELPSSALLADDLPAPRSFSGFVLSRLAACPTGAEALVVAASVLGLRCGLGLAARLGDVADPLAALEAAVDAGLLEPRSTPTATQVAFSHSLVRAAVYHDLAPTRRAALHARAAELVDEEGPSLRHRVAAAATEDAELAREVHGYARREAQRGAWAAAATAFLSAARLSPGRGDRESHLLQAFDCLILAGDFAQALTLSGELQAFADEARQGYAMGRLALFAGNEGDAEQLLVRAWDRCDPRADPELAARIAATVAVLFIRAARAALAADWARRALQYDPAASTAGLARTVLAMGLTASGQTSAALAAMGPLPEDPRHVGAEEADGLLGRGIVRLWTDDLAGASTDLSVVVAACRRGGPFHFRLLGLFYLGDVEYRLGRWDDAMLHAGLAASQADDSEEAWALGLTHAVAAFALAGRGDEERARRHAETAWRAATEIRDPGSLLWAAMARGRVGLARGDHAAVAVALHPILMLAPTHPDIDQPGIQPWRELYAEALVRLGRLEEAEAVLVRLETLATERARHSSLMGAARVRGLLEAARGHQREAEAAFEAGLGHASQLDMPFERALLDDAYGRFLRRRGERRRARERLGCAQEVYARLGARPFVEGLERELAACGLTPSRRSAARRLDLTPQELAVARLVSGGMTNREAAAELMVSVKTVGYHLGNVYTKLGVSSRTQLAVRFAAKGS